MFCFNWTSCSWILTQHKIYFWAMSTKRILSINQSELQFLPLEKLFSETSEEKWTVACTVWVHSVPMFQSCELKKNRIPRCVSAISRSSSLQWNLMFWSDKTSQRCHVGDFIYWKHTSLSLTVRGKCLLTALHSWDFTDSQCELSKLVDFCHIAA